MKRFEPKQWKFRKNRIIERGEFEDLRYQTLLEEIELLKTLSISESIDYYISKLQYFRRKHGKSSEEFDIEVTVGDICYIDFGCAYQYEIGYLHFGIVLSKSYGKIFVVPLTGTQPSDNPNTSRIIIGRLQGMTKDNVCYINDAKWINSARVVDKKGHVDPNSKLFKDLKKLIISQIL